MWREVINFGDESILICLLGSWIVSIIMLIELYVVEVSVDRCGSMLCFTEISLPPT